MYLESDGAFGSCPSEYLLCRAARYLGVAPWELLEREPVWMTAALAFERAEAHAQWAKQRQAERAAKYGSKR